MKTSINKLTGLLLICFAGSVSAEYIAQVYLDSQGRKLNYQIHIPEKIHGAVPLVLFLHGAGERGEDNRKQLRYGAKNILAYSKQYNKPVIIVAPQCPAGKKWVDTDWHALAHAMPEQPSENMALVMNLLRQVIHEQPVDPSRIYVTGLSMGGFGTWDIIQRNPDLFAAAIPICGGGDPSRAEAIHELPIWIFHGDSDPVVKTQRSRDMVQAIERCGGNPKYTEYSNTKHNAWTPTYTNIEVLHWLFEQQKSH